MKVIKAIYSHLLLKINICFYIISIKISFSDYLPYKKSLKHTFRMRRQLQELIPAALHNVFVIWPQCDPG